MKNKTTQIIDAFGGTKKVIEILGLTKGRVYQFQNWDTIPRHWLMVLILMRPDLNWTRLGQKSLYLETIQAKDSVQADREVQSAAPGQIHMKRSK